MKKSKSLVEQIYKDIRKEWDKERKSMESYISQLESGMNDWSDKYQALESQYHKDIPVNNSEMGYMSSIGAVEEEPEEMEDRVHAGFKQNTK